MSELILGLGVSLGLAIYLVVTLLAPERSVPRDLSLIGYDDTMADILTPPVTSIAQPISDLGYTAVRMAISAIETNDVPAATVSFPTRLVVRKSTARPKVDV